MRSDTRFRITVTQAFRPLASGFLRAAERFPGRMALEVGGQALDYASLRERAAVLAATLQQRAAAEPEALTAVLAHRSATAFCGILGALLRGHGYVPLNPFFPAERTAAMFERAGTTSIVVGEEARPALRELLTTTRRTLLVVLPASRDLDDLRQDFPRHTFVGAGELHEAAQWQPLTPQPDATAYLLFTSGSTGIPKGVPVTHANIRHFLDVVTERYRITEQDRFSQMFELVFDLSLFDMFAAWECGACVCCPARGEAQMPARFILESGVTIWFSVPALAIAMKRLRMLEPGLYPGVRLALFCGEALLEDTARQWAAAAPNAVVENLYGPTEATLACTAYRWQPDRADSGDGDTVPIGTAFPGMTTLVVDEQLREVGQGEAGELLLTGPQLAPGYWHDAERTAAAFVRRPGEPAACYRTGDRVRQPLPGGPLVYLGRMDQQIKINGNRVELGEVEAVLRTASGVDTVVALGWPVTAAGADGIIAFIGSTQVDPEQVRIKAARRLPTYMMPREIRLSDDIPLNSNGKVDRKALLARLGITE